MEEVKILRLQPGDILQVVIRSNDVNDNIIKILRKMYEEAIEKALGKADAVPLLVLGVEGSDDVTATVIRADK